MNLKWPWNEFPKNQETWEKCKEQFEEALMLLLEALWPIDKKVYIEKIIAFIDKVKESEEPKETITIEEFKNLPLHITEEAIKGGRIALGEKGHRRQCENLKVGDKVFFFKTEVDGEVREGVELGLELVVAKVVEEEKVG